MKVVNFPLDEVREYQGTKVGQESMWVKVLDGDIHKGLGVVVNTPHFDNCAAQFGDLIEYDDRGKAEMRPDFVAVIERAEA